ncbi:hypothetical protein K4K58_004617 [Colletotrichum sp. SAR11_239]|nr:hypothetical protein K4K58_004617 [Colletotrichum sp. SAR11_239]
MQRYPLEEIAAAMARDPFSSSSVSQTTEDIELVDMSSHNEAMNSIFKAAEAPRSTFTLDKTRFYLPEGPLSDDAFWVPLPDGDRGKVDHRGPHLVDTEPIVKIKKRARGMSYRGGSWIVDIDLQRPRCFVAHGTMAEECMVRRMQTDCRAAAKRLAATMGGIFWQRIQGGGGVDRLTNPDIAGCLARTADALFEFTNITGRFIEVTRRRHLKEDVSPLFKGVLKLLGIVEWHRVHRAVNAVQILRRSFEGLTARCVTGEEKMAQYAAQSCKKTYMLGMMGWRLAPDSIGSQQGALSQALHSLHVLGTADWMGYDAQEVKARMAQKSTPVCLVKDNFFCAWTFGMAVRFLTHQNLQCSWSAAELANCPGPWRFEGHIYTSHLEMLKTLPWVECFTGLEHTRVRFRPVSCSGCYDRFYEGKREDGEKSNRAKKEKPEGKKLTGTRTW